MYTLVYCLLPCNANLSLPRSYLLLQEYRPHCNLLHCVNSNRRSSQKHTRDKKQQQQQQPAAAAAEGVSAAGCRRTSAAI
jgi:hypothetical protein